MRKENLVDNHGRKISYLRLAVTDRCNLRCFYCMPEHGIKYIPKNELLTFEEMHSLVKILVKLGIDKIRVTGGEPFVRKDLINFIEKLTTIEGLNQIAITSNGVLISPYLDKLKELGVDQINLSLDTLDEQRFYKITRRNEFAKVMKTLEQLISKNFKIKINCVVMQDQNIEDIIPLVELTRDTPLSVRFIEEMPFNGEGIKYDGLMWDHILILNHISDSFDTLEKLVSEPASTSINYQIPGFSGSFGIIPAFSRTFCGTCNRIRITAKGTLKTCLYDDGVMDLKSLIRSGASDKIVMDKLLHSFSKRPVDGFEAEEKRSLTSVISESMSTIGG